MNGRILIYSATFRSFHRRLCGHERSTRDQIALPITYRTSVLQVNKPLTILSSSPQQRMNNPSLTTRTRTHDANHQMTKDSRTPLVPFEFSHAFPIGILQIEKRKIIPSYQKNSSLSPSRIHKLAIDFGTPPRTFCKRFCRVDRPPSSDAINRRNDILPPAPVRLFQPQG
ncbi:MAG: hypothetical protein M2R45_00224 [Verrucomicrobia subdivision 3 bacterium]|nr:hypothetical protein [Limisphaerales bacterium]MCS1412318.1 hypothetical protein [Limisphaerales bacterium]